MLNAYATSMTLRSVTCAAMLALIALIVQPLNAQGVFDMGSLTNTLSIDHVTQSERARSSGVSSLDLSKRTMLQLTAPVTSSHSPSETAFAVSKKMRRENLNRIVEKTAANDPVGAKQMAQIFAAGDIIADIGKGIAPFGLRTDNVADAYTVYWMTAWQAAHQDNSDFDASSVASVRQQSADILMNVDAFASADDAIKQELAEIYLVQAALIQAVADNAGTDRQLKSKLAAAVKEGASASGMDLDSMTLTRGGFQPVGKRRTDAADTDGVKDKRFASSDSSSGNDGISNSQLMLIAAAGGAGLAGVFLFGKAVGKKG